jgi:proteasome alpha subunit
VSMPFYVSPEQAMKDKADYARKNIARGRNTIVIEYADGILFVAPNPSRALHKISEIYDRIAFAAVGMYNEFENLRKAGVRYADFNGYLYDKSDVTALGLANAYAQTLGTIFTESNKPYEVEIVVAEVGQTPDRDQLYRITFDGSVADEHGYVAMGGQADRVSAALKERYSENMTLAGALGVALAALGDQGNGERADSLSATQLEVALLDRNGEHRRFRRLTGPRLEALLAEAKAGSAKADGPGQPAVSGGTDSAGPGEGGSGDGSAGTDGPAAGG